MYYCNKCGQEMIDSGHRCAVRSERLTSVVRSNAATGWISVKDRLPEKGACVITFEPHCINNPDKGIGVCEVDSDFTDKKSDGNFWITHWMPLPETPEV